jgi:hypothetical protein
MRSFENSKIRGKYWHILVDATQICTFKERHCPHCLTREHKDKKKNILWVDYYHVVLEAKLVLHDNIVLSIATEFVENELDEAGKPVPEPESKKKLSQEKKKQDCELKAFYRMAEKLKKRFPKLPICLGMDSLYTCGPVFDLCKKYNWRFIIRFKDGSISSVAKDFHELKKMEANQIWTRTEDSVTKTYRYVTKIPYQVHDLNIAECEQSDLEHSFIFVTDLPVTKKNCERLIQEGRRRWKIENEGFNEQKNHGLGLTHLFSENYTAMKNHYYLIQIGHMIAQFLAASMRRLTALATTTTRRLFDEAKEAFRTQLLTDADRYAVEQVKQHRLYP